MINFLNFIANNNEFCLCFFIADNISKGTASAPKLFLGPNDLPTPTTRKANMENIQLSTFGDENIHFLTYHMR